MYTLKYQGRSYQATTVDGRTVYDPPLPPDAASRSNKRLKEMLASQQAPGLRTDTQFHAGRGTLLQQLQGDDVYADYLVKESKKHGYTPGANDVYIGQMADKDGDPKAWFKPGEGRSELKRRAEASGKGIEMPGLHVAPKEKPRKHTPLNPRLVNTLERQYKAEGKEMSRADIIKKHGRAHA